MADLPNKSSSRHKRIRIQRGARAAIAAAIVVGAALALNARTDFGAAADPSLAAARVISFAAMLEEKFTKPFDYLSSSRSDG
jgi:hypothetical protein